jgi:hypothetical protein
MVRRGMGLMLLCRIAAVIRPQKIYGNIHYFRSW